MLKKMILKGCGVIPFLISHHVYSSISLENTIYEKVAEKYQLDPILLYAVSLAESAKKREQGMISPWSWTLRSKSGAFYENNQEAAQKKLTELLQTESVDIGLMQINTKWNGHRVDDFNHLLNPETNLEIGAQILAESIASTPDLELGLGRYHTWSDENRARNYGQRVLAIYQNIQGY